MESEGSLPHSQALATLSQFNTVRTSQSPFLQTHFNITLPSMRVGQELISILTQNMSVDCFSRNAYY
jgi:hypothetical protein